MGCFSAGLLAQRLRCRVILISKGGNRWLFTRPTRAGAGGRSHGRGGKVNVEIRNPVGGSSLLKADGVSGKKIRFGENRQGNVKRIR